MNQQYNMDDISYPESLKNAKPWMPEHTGIDLIIEFCKRVLDYGLSRGLSVNGIAIFLRSSMKNALNVGEYLTVDYQGIEYRFQIIEDNRIIEYEMGDGIQTDILIYDPKWGENEPTIQS